MRLNFRSIALKYTLFPCNGTSLLACSNAVYKFLYGSHADTPKARDLLGWVHSQKGDNRNIV